MAIVSTWSRVFRIWTAKVCAPTSNLLIRRSYGIPHVVCQELLRAASSGYGRRMNEYDHDLSALRIDTPPTLRAMVLERLRRAIISGVFKPGQRLVERTLCDQLGVSRSVIREVIRHLDAEGLVT